MKRLFLALSLTVGLAQAAFAADSGLLVRSGFSGLTPTANQTWVFNQLDNRLYAFDGTNYQQQTLGRIQGSGVGAPGASNDSTQNYSVGSLWYDSVGLQWYVCTRNTASAAIWNQITNRVAQTDINNSIAPELTYGDIMSDCVVSGLCGSVPGSSLTMTTPGGVAYVSGSRIVTSPNAYTFTASKDTYCYLQTNGSINYVPVSNGAGAPVGQTGLPIQKVVTGTYITSVTQLASTAPVTNTGTATPGTQNSLNITQADSRYATYGSISGPFSANYVMASPSGSSGALSARALVSADLPTISCAQGGFGASVTPSALAIPYGTGTAFASTTTPPGPLYYLRSNASNNALEWALTAGIGSITLTDSSGIYTYSGPLTTSGTITGTLATQAARTVLAGVAPLNGSTAAPTFRKLGKLDVFGDYSGLRPLPCATPSAPTLITHGGTTGATSYTYAVAAVMPDGVTITAASTTLATANGNATLTGVNTNIITMPTLPTGALSFNIYRTASSGTPASTGLIGNTTGATFTDTGIVATGTTPATTVMIGDYFQGTTAWTQPGPITSSYVRIYGAATLTFNNTYTCVTECAGGVASTAPASTQSNGGSAGAGFGGGGGGGGVTFAASGGGVAGGGGGGHGGAGGSASTLYQQCGGTYPLSLGLAGSGGGAGSGYNTNTGGNGGQGGGSLYIENAAPVACNSGTAITANGANGVAGTVGGGGGGSGGAIQVRSLGTVTISVGASITANGGNGGNGTTGGGGGGGGILDFSGSTVTISGTATAAGGTAGTGGTPTAGSPGPVNTYNFVQGQRSAP